MKNIFLLAGLALINSLFAACPSGYFEVDAGPLYVITNTTCPSGYAEIPVNRLILPSGGLCDTAKGACNTAGVCLVP